MTPAARANSPPALDTPSANALLQTWQQLQPRLQNNPYGQPLVIESSASGHQVQGDVYAELDFAQSRVNTSLDNPAAWCDWMVLPMNTKGCNVTADGGIALYIGKKTPEPLDAAVRLDFAFQRVHQSAGALHIVLTAPQGPLGTSGYRIVLESVALPRGRSFLHLRYAYQVSLTGQLAFAAYLNSTGRNKVGFSSEGGALVGGVRGLVERTTMRYYLAIDAYLRSLALAPQQQTAFRLQTWYQQSERYPRQLHEVGRDAYLEMKRAEILRQQGAVPGPTPQD